MAKGKPGPGKKYSPWLGFRPGLKRRDDMTEVSNSAPMQDFADCPYGRIGRDCCNRFPCVASTPPHPETCPGCHGAAYDFTEERNALLHNLMPGGSYEGWQQNLVDEFIDYVVHAHGGEFAKPRAKAIEEGEG